MARMVPWAEEKSFFLFPNIFSQTGKGSARKKDGNRFCASTSGLALSTLLEKRLSAFAFSVTHICRPHLRSSGYRGGSELRAGSRRDTKVRGSSKQATPSNPLIAAITGLEGVRNFEPRLLMAVHITTRIFEIRSPEPPLTP